ncbi:MAG: HupE/UreJ family protein [Cytophagales bacterium]|jgi:hypothetical protein|nr:HupE/UreJ family protein [Cytophagales bacterium]
MNEFQAYLILGFDHITDVNGYDHILFIVALCAVYQMTDWKRILVLVTAFTVGHSITLALATMQLFTYRSDVIEFLIPVTIFITAFGNLAHKFPKSEIEPDTRPPRLRYVMALLFGLIHGLGFSNFLRSMLGREQSIVQPLLAFNIGLELGQLIIVGLLVGAAFAANRLLGVPRRDWNLILSGATAGIALTLIQKTCIF